MKRREFLKKCAFAAVGASLCGSAVTKAGISFKNKTLNFRIGRKQPNVIYIMADDLGYGDLGCYGQEKIKTPHIDKLALEGIKFTDHYSGSTVCAPSRCALMTGLHMGHAFIRNNANLGGGCQRPIPAESITVAEMFKQAGYTTACIGKWGLGGGEIPDPNKMGHPNNQGFDLFFGYLCQVQAHEYYPDYLWRNEEQIILNGQYYSHDLMTEEALGFINDYKDQPFFLYIPYTIPHTNFQVLELGIYENMAGWTDDQKTQAAMITRMDRDVGRIMALLKKHGIDDNTLVIFTSDNGPHGQGDTLSFFDANGPLRDKKGSLYEGGIRVPQVARWPGKIKPGSVTDHISAFWDLLPTCCDLIGIKPPTDIDGISFLPTLLGKPGSQQAHDYLYWEIPTGDGKQAIRMGKWKAVWLDAKTNPNPTIALYNLVNDIDESSNVASLNPDIVTQMEQIRTEAHVYSPEYPLLYSEVN